MKGGLLLDVVITQSTAVLKLLTSEDKTLLIRRNTFLVLNLGLYVVNGVGGFDIKSDSLTGECFYENLCGKGGMLFVSMLSDMNNNTK